MHNDINRAQLHELDDKFLEAFRNCPKETKFEGMQGVIIGPDPYIRTIRKVGRNEKCPCNSGLKFKKCCIDKVGEVYD